MNLVTFFTRNHFNVSLILVNELLIIIYFYIEDYKKKKFPFARNIFF